MSPVAARDARSMSAAVVPASSRFAAEASLSVEGFANTFSAGTVNAVAYPPYTRNARTSSPGDAAPEAISVPGPSAAITPDTS